MTAVDHYRAQARFAGAVADAAPSCQDKAHLREIEALWERLADFRAAMLSAAATVGFDVPPAM